MLKTLESPLDCKESQPVYPKGNESWVFIGRIDDEAETPVLWPPDTKSWLTGKDPDAGKDRRQKEKEVTEDEMVGWHRWLNDHELSKLWEIVKDREAWHAAIYGVTKSQTGLSDWTTKEIRIVPLIFVLMGAGRNRGYYEGGTQRASKVLKMFEYTSTIQVNQR